MKRTIVFTICGILAVGAPAAATDLTSRTVNCNESDIIPIYAQKNISTLIQLPKGEKAMLVVIGDEKNWDVAKQESFVFISPAYASRSGLSTNLNIVGSSGNVYKFLIREVAQSGQQSDMAVQVKPSGSTMLQAVASRPVFVSSDEVDGYKQKLAEAQKSLEAEKQREAADASRNKEVVRGSVESSIKHDYTWKSDKKTERIFNVSSIYNVDGFTVIEANPQEAPALYEVKDNKDSLIQYELQNGKYVVPKVVYDGYLRVGKNKMTFHREG